MTKKDTASQKHKLVKDFEISGQSQREFAASHGIKEGELYYWISKLRKSKKVVSEPTTSQKSFVPIAVSSIPAQEVRSILIRCTSGVEIEIPL